MELSPCTLRCYPTTLPVILRIQSFFLWHVDYYNTILHLARLTSAGCKSGYNSLKYIPVPMFLVYENWGVKWQCFTAVLLYITYIILYITYVTYISYILQVYGEKEGTYLVDLCKPASNSMADDQPISMRDALVFQEFACFSSGHSVPLYPGGEKLLILRVTR